MVTALMEKSHLKVFKEIFIDQQDFSFITWDYFQSFFLLFVLSNFYFHVHLLKYTYLKVNIFVMCARLMQKFPLKISKNYRIIFI